jgi:uncharacterized protein YndB with AHSA1/START domain
MDGARFDRLTRALAQVGPTRRRLVAGLLGAAGVVGWKRTAEAACPPETVQASRGRCVCKTTGRPPVDGVCPCPNGQIRCEGVCTMPVNGECPCEPCGLICCEPGTVCVYPGTCSPEDTVVAAPTEAVWDALVEPEALAAWGMSNNVAPRVGHRFQLRTVDRAGVEQTIEGEVVEIEPLRRAVFTWNDPAFPRTATVTVSLEPLDGGEQTRLRISSDGGAVVCRRAIRLLGPGWRKTLIGESLPRYLAGGAGRGDE